MPSMKVEAALAPIVCHVSLALLLLFAGFTQSRRAPRPDIVTDVNLPALSTSHVAALDASSLRLICCSFNASYRSCAHEALALHSSVSAIVELKEDCSETTSSPQAATKSCYDHAPPSRSRGNSIANRCSSLLETFAGTQGI